MDKYFCIVIVLIQQIRVTLTLALHIQPYKLKKKIDHNFLAETAVDLTQMQVRLKYTILLFKDANKLNNYHLI